MEDSNQADLSPLHHHHHPLRKREELTTKKNEENQDDNQDRDAEALISFNAFLSMNQSDS